MKVIAVSGFARCGKDTFVSIAKNILSKNGYSPFRSAFADTLKEEIRGMLYKNGFQLDIESITPEEKELVRPLFVFWGCQRRNESSHGNYWINEVDKHLLGIKKDYENNHQSTENVVALISDCRFRNEADWIHEKWDGCLIHLKRYSVEYKWPNGQERDPHHRIESYNNPPNKEEKEQDPLVLEVSDLQLEWEDKKEKTFQIATENPYLIDKVLHTLNRCKFFNGKLVL